MADFAITKPTVGGSSGTWGTELNAALDVLVAHPGIKVVSDATAKAAYVPLLGQVILQADTGTLYKCTNATGPVWAEVGGNPVTNGKEVALDSVNETTIATRTPAAAANVMVGIYFRVITDTTNVTVKVTYTDATGAQTNTLLDTQACAVGSYSLPMLMFNATAAPITVSITAGTANQVYGSATIMEVG